MAHPTSGKHRCYTSHKSFYAFLADGESIKLSIHGRMSGTLGGHLVSGYGHLEYTYIEGGTEWVRSDIDGSASGPATILWPLAEPTASLVYDPSGTCRAKVSIEASGTPEIDQTGFKHKKDHWKMKGRTDTLTITIAQVVTAGPPTCTWDAVDPCSGTGAAVCAFLLPDCPTEYPLCVTSVDDYRVAGC